MHCSAALLSQTALLHCTAQLCCTAHSDCMLLTGSSQVKKLLLPTQRVHLMAETLSIGDHLHVSMALARAIRDDTV